MKINFYTISKPNFDYAVSAFNLYFKRLKFYHDVTVYHFKNTASVKEILTKLKDDYLIILSIEGINLSSEDLALFLTKLSKNNKTTSFIIGGAEGLSPEIMKRADYNWSLSNLTLPHDMAMILAMEALYRASTINLGLPYHK